MIQIPGKSRLKTARWVHSAIYPCGSWLIAGKVCSLFPSLVDTRNPPLVTRNSPRKSSSVHTWRRRYPDLKNAVLSDRKYIPYGIFISVERLVINLRSRIVNRIPTWFDRIKWFAEVRTYDGDRVIVWNHFEVNGFCGKDR